MNFILLTTTLLALEHAMLWLRENDPYNLVDLNNIKRSANILIQDYKQTGIDSEHWLARFENLAVSHLLEK